MEAPAIMRPMKRVRRIFVGGSLVAVIGTVGIGPVMAKTVTPPAPAPKPARGAAPWAAPADPLRLIFAAGLRPERKETLIHHVHSHLDVFVNGARVIVPAERGLRLRTARQHTGASSFAASRAFRPCTRTTTPAFSTPNQPPLSRTG